MQVFPQRFISFLAVYMHTTGGMRTGDPDVAISNPKAHTFTSFEGASNPKVGTIECIKVHHLPFQCLQSAYVEEAKPGNLIEMHIYWPSKAALNRQMPYHKKDEKTPTTELEESDTEDHSIDEECTGEAE